MISTFLELRDVKSPGGCHIHLSAEAKIPVISKPKREGTRYLVTALW